MPSTKQSADAKMPKEEKNILKLTGDYKQSQANWATNPSKGNTRKVVKARKKLTKTWGK